MFTNNIIFKNFKNKTKSNNKKIFKIKKAISTLVKKKHSIIQSMCKKYNYSYTKENLLKYKNHSNFRLIGMGGSILGSQAIYDFLNFKIKKKFFFIDNLQSRITKEFKKNITNIVVSKSGNTLETIVNFNILAKNKDKNIIITEKNNTYLYQLAKKLKAEIIHHNNYIGGRYSVLSEVGMLPAELMGLKEADFKQLNFLINNNKFINELIYNVDSILNFINTKKHNSVIINYDQNSENLFKWYQQLVAESLGKQGKGILPIVSNMPKDNHSIMQLFLDGNKSNFYTFFYVKEKGSEKINNKKLLNKNFFLKNKSLMEITYAQKIATEDLFRKKNIPFRSFEIQKRNEKTLGQLFCFFILETILVAEFIRVNPYDQPAVEAIKKKTRSILTF